MGVPITVMQYNSLITAIPANWKRDLSTDNIENYKELPTIHVKLNNKNVELKILLHVNKFMGKLLKKKL